MVPGRDVLVKREGEEGLVKGRACGGGAAWLLRDLSYCLSCLLYRVINAFAFASFRFIGMSPRQVVHNLLDRPARSVAHFVSV